jgi:hypothetical protein
MGERVWGLGFWVSGSKFEVQSANASPAVVSALADPKGVIEPVPV